MPNYLARVVLHRLNSKGNDSYEDYSDFHAEMAKIGFEQTIIGFDENNNKVVSKLPGGLYYFNGKRSINNDRLPTLKEAYDAVYKAVSEVVEDETRYIQKANEPHTVFVTEAGNSRWIGLEYTPVPPGIQIKGRES